MPRIKLCDQYKTEREEICNSLLEIIQLDSENAFLLSELDANIEKQTAIMNLKTDIQKCFACSEMAPFKLNPDCSRPYLSIVRGILRKQGYTFVSTNCSYKVDNLKKGTTKYLVFRNK